MSVREHASDTRSSHSVFARVFRRALLARRDSMTVSHREYLRSIFPKKSEGDSCVITTAELKKFLTSLNLSPFIVEEDVKINAAKFISLLLQQVDINRTGSVSYSYLCEFLWPNECSNRDLDFVAQLVRQTIVDAIGRKIIARSSKSSNDDLFLLEAFSRQVNAPLVRGSMISVRTLRKALPRMVMCELGEELPRATVDSILTTMDSNCDGVVTAREFKTWLFMKDEDVQLLRRYSVLSSRSGIASSSSSIGQMEGTLTEPQANSPEKDDSTIASGLTFTDSLVSGESKNPDKVPTERLLMEREILASIQAETEELTKLQEKIEQAEVARQKALAEQEAEALRLKEEREALQKLHAVVVEHSIPGSLPQIDAHSTGTKFNSNGTTVSPLHSETAASEESGNIDGNGQFVRDVDQVESIKRKPCCSCLVCNWGISLAMVYDPIDEEKGQVS